MTNNLAPCPFCGGEPKLRTHRSGEDSMECYVECPSCEVRTTYYEDADATEAWNRRTPPPATHVDGVQALLNSLDRTAIAKIVDPSAWLNEGGYEIEQEHSGTSLHVADQIVTYVLRKARALATTEGSAG